MSTLTELAEVVDRLRDVGGGSMRERRRVYVTGIGLVSPHGDEPDAVFDNLMRGRSAIALWDRDDVPPVAVARVGFTPDRWFNKLQLSGVDRSAKSRWRRRDGSRTRPLAGQRRTASHRDLRGQRHGWCHGGRRWPRSISPASAWLH